MNEDVATLTELMLLADRFCGRIEMLLQDAAPSPEDDFELKAKLGLCRNAIGELQTAYEHDTLSIDIPRTRATFRTLLIGLMWVAYRSRRFTDYKTFRMLVQIESSYTFLLCAR